MEEFAPPVDFADPEIPDVALSDTTLRTLVTSLQSVGLISYSGPMPPPADFEAYEQILTGTALVIRDSWVNEQNHRRRMEEREMTLREEGQSASIKFTNRGQWIATAFGIGILALAFYMFRKEAFSQSAALAISSLLAFSIALFGSKLPWHRKD